MYKILTNFDSNPLIRDPTLFPGKNIPNIAKSVRVFPGNWKEDRALILTYLDSSMAEVFPHYSLSFSISAILRGKQIIKVGTKVKTLGLSAFHQNSNPSNLFQTMILLARVLPLVRIPAILRHIWGHKSPKTAQKRPWYAKRWKHLT